MWDGKLAAGSRGGGRGRERCWAAKAVRHVHMTGVITNTEAGSLLLGIIRCSGILEESQVVAKRGRFTGLLTQGTKGNADLP